MNFDDNHGDMGKILVFFLCIPFCIAQADRPDAAQKMERIEQRWFQLHWQQFQDSLQLCRHFTDFLKARQKNLTISESMARFQQFRKLNSSHMERAVLSQNGLRSLHTSITNLRKELELLSAKALKTRYYPMLAELRQKLLYQEETWLFLLREINQRHQTLLSELNQKIQDLMTSIRTSEEENWKSSRQNHLLIQEGEIVRQIRQMTASSAANLKKLKDFYTWSEARLREPRLQTATPPFGVLKALGPREKQEWHITLSLLSERIEQVTSDQKIRLKVIEGLLQSETVLAEVSLPHLSLHLYTNNSLHKKPDPDIQAKKTAPISESQPLETGWL